MSSKKIEISKSSLVGLKAELARKQEEVNRAKSEAKNNFVHVPPQPKKQTVLTRKNAGVDDRNAKDYEEIRKDEDDLKKSRDALEAKSKLYDQLSRRPLGSEVDDRQFLVDFEQKSREDEHCINLAEPEEDADEFHSDNENALLDSESDWVDYVDCLGRTRRCLRQDLTFVKEKDAKLAQSLSLVAEEPVVGEPAVQPELVSAASVKREEMRRRWEEQELRLRDKIDVHYQDVLFDEARAHGVGYYGFSSDEAERRAQQEALGKMRQETSLRQRQAQEARNRRQQQLAARLKAARNRQRARLGLPPEEDEPEKPATETEEELGPAEILQPEEISEKISEPPSTVPKVRPWDIGKEGVGHQVLSQEEWIKVRRDDRLQEFAPPPSYSEDAASSGRSQGVRKKWARSTLFPKKQTEHSPDTGQVPHEEDEPISASTYAEDVDLLGPQPTMFFTTKRQRVSQQVPAPGTSNSSVAEQDIPRTVSEVPPQPTYLDDAACSGRSQGMRGNWAENTLSSKRPDYSPGFGEVLYGGGTQAAPPAYLEDMALLGPEPTMYFTTKRQKTTAAQSAPGSGVAEHESNTTQASQKKGVKIAPPPTYEYYGPSGTSLRKDMNKLEMENAITAGLQYLRQHAEEKEARREKGMLPII